jgi:hypothetical protein
MAFQDVRYYIDPELGVPHIYRHSVVEEVVEDVLHHADEDRPGREGSRIAIGKTRKGKFLRVICVLDPTPDSVFVITAYQMFGKPLHAFRRRMRGKG